MRSTRAVCRVCVLCIVGWAAGCGSTPALDGAASGADEFLGVRVADFEGARAIPVFDDAVTSESTDAALPEDLVAIAPDEAVMVLSAPDVVVTVDDEAGQLYPAGGIVEHYATVTFGLAPPGSGPCVSDTQIGPFELTIVDGAVTLANESLPLTAAARALVRSGRFEICIQTWADFDGTIAVSKLQVEFGSLRADQQRVELCHITPGNPNARHTIVVAEPAVAAHLAHGDYLGPCRDFVADVELTSMCSDDPDVQRRWRIRNPNDFDVAVTWEVYGTDQTESMIAPPGDSYFFTETIGGPNTTTIRWLDEIGGERSTTKASGAVQCAPDADADGVADEVDLCPDTPPGSEVDADGCTCEQLGNCDADGDGVTDDADNCPFTPAGETPDSAGCSCSQRDGDGDGVNDCDDACPNTFGEGEVDANGCTVNTLDDDNDGMANTADACPETPPGEAVDETGCSCSQSDEDGDGVNDCDDLCPNTAADALVDASGCQIAVADAGPDVTIDEVACVTLQGSASGGTPPYTYSWSAPGWEGSMEQNPTVVPSETTTYTLTVTDWSSPPEVVTDTVTITIRSHDGLKYAVVNLGSLSVNASYPSNINDAGQVVGYYYDDSWNKRAFLYGDGTMVDLGTLGGTEAYARDINNAGQVVGQARNSLGNWRAFLWGDAHGMRDLGTLNGASSAAYAINESGEVVGHSDTASGSHAFLYSNGAMTDLGKLDTFQSGAFDINDNTQVVGTYLAYGFDQQGFISDGGTFIDLGSPLLSGSRAVGVNNAGLVVGYSWGFGEFRSFLYACDTVIDLGFVDGFAKTYVWNVNNAGQVVGNLSTADATLSHAALYTGGRLYDLNDLLVTGHGWEYLTVAFAINDVRQITGYGRIDGRYRAFLMTPVP